MENTIENYQPSGLKAFGWGVLGYMGTNIVMNVVAFMFGLVLGSLDAMYPGAIIVIILVAGIAGYIFASARKYEATTNGGYVAVALGLFLSVVSLGAV